MLTSAGVVSQKGMSEFLCNESRELYDGHDSPQALASKNLLRQIRYLKLNFQLILSLHAGPPFLPIRWPTSHWANGSTVVIGKIGCLVRYGMVLRAA
jgi:hypothetical protein